MIRRLFLALIDIIKRHRRRQLRRVMRGYRALRLTGRLERINAVKRALTNHSLGLTRRHFSPIVMGRRSEAAELVVRQFLLNRIGGVNLNCALQASLAGPECPVVFHLPGEWHDVLASHGFKIARFRSTILWQVYVFVHLIYGLLKIVKIAIGGISFGKHENLSARGYAFFDGLLPNTLPQQCNGNKSHDVISWYLRWPGKVRGIEVVRHDVSKAFSTAVDGISILPSQGPLPSLQGIRSSSSFLIWGIQAGLIATFDFIRGRWWHALMLSEAALAAQAQKLPDNLLAREYLFHNSGWIYRPLWTYETEARGAAITFYFYSTNMEGFKSSKGYPPNYYGFKSMSWTHYLVWDNHQADFVRRAIGETARISIVGVIWFSSSLKTIPAIIAKAIAVFDVAPMRTSFYQTLGVDFDYFVPSTNIGFVSDILQIAKDSGHLMLWKHKRKIGKHAHPAYRKFTKQFESSTNIIILDSDISAYRVIEASELVISMPFTSTALIARHLGKPSCYYDPTGLLLNDDHAAHGIPIIQGILALKNWVTTHSATHNPGLTREL